MVDNIRTVTYLSAYTTINTRTSLTLPTEDALKIKHIKILNGGTSLLLLNELTAHIDTPDTLDIVEAKHLSKLSINLPITIIEANINNNVTIPNIEELIPHVHKLRRQQEMQGLWSTVGIRWYPDMGRESFCWHCSIDTVIPEGYSHICVIGTTDNVTPLFTVHAD